MRSILLVQLLAVLAVVLGNPTPTKPVSARQMTRKELVARAKYPELFGRRARIVGRVAPENLVQVVDDPDDDGDALLPVIIEDDPPEPLTTQAPIDCPSRKRRRRDLQDKFETPLSAREAAAFILGRGEFTWDNGTVYRDEAYIEILAKAASNYNSWYRRSFNTVRDAYGSAYMEATVPAVTRFFRYWGDGELVWFSDNTAIRGGDLPKIGPILLESPDFQSIQVHGWTLSRKLVEILQSV